MPRAKLNVIESQILQHPRWNDRIRMCAARFGPHLESDVPRVLLEEHLGEETLDRTMLADEENGLARWCGQPLRDNVVRHTKGGKSGQDTYRPSHHEK